MRTRVATALLTAPLAGALSGCWMPNPLFLDGLVTASETEPALTTVADPSTTGPEPVTTSDPPGSTTAFDATTEPVDPMTTSTTGSETTASITGDTTTGEAPLFACADPDGMGCCDVVVPPIADTFFIDASDSGGPDKCPYTPDNDPLVCIDSDFGKLQQASVFRDMAAGTFVGTSVYAVRFDIADGRIVHAEGDIPFEWIAPGTAKLALTGMFHLGTYDKFEFSFKKLPDGVTWQEGPKSGAACIKTPDHAPSSWRCRVCGGAVDAPCVEEWSKMAKPSPLDGDTLQASVLVTGEQNLEAIEIPIDPGWVAEPQGFLLAPIRSHTKGMPQDNDFIVPFTFNIDTREGAEGTKLALRVCPKA